MTGEHVERAFREHPGFEKRGDGEFRTTQKPFETTVVVTDAEGGGAHEYRVVVRTPTLDAKVEGEVVSEVVETGWFETLELRLEDVHTVAANDSAAPPTIEREDDEVVVTVEFTGDDPERAAEDALAIAEYVEGTWVQGIIPGYDYREPVAGLREQAMQNYDDGDEAGGSGRGDSDSSSGPPL